MAERPTIIDDGATLRLLDAVGRMTKEGARAEASVLSSFAINFDFYEEVVLRLFRRAGCRLNVLLIDAGMLAAAMSDPHLRPRRAGIDYLLVPVEAPGAFHPKVLALLSEKRPLLAVGSHNVTEAGFAKNLEVTTCWGHDGAGVPAEIMAAAMGFLSDWLARSHGFDQGFVGEVSDRLRQLCPKGGAADGARFVGWRLGGPSLLDQLRSMVTGTVTRVLVVGPFFDDGFGLLRKLDETWRPADLVAAVQPATVSFRGLAEAPPGARFVDASSLLVSRMGADTRQGAATPYLHAKALAVETDDGLWLALGSANPSWPAWCQAERGNAEAVVVLSGDAAKDAYARKGNAEAVIVLSGDAAKDAYARLGFVELVAARPLSREELDEAVARAEARVERPAASAGKVQVAMVSADRILVQGINAAECVRAVDLGEIDRDLDATFTAVSEGTEVAIHGTHSTMIRIDGETGPLATVILHSLRDFRASTRPHSSARILDRLGCLDDVDADLDGIVEALEKYIFADEGAKSGSSATSKPQTTQPSAGAAVPPGPRGVSIANLDTTGRRSVRIVDFELSEVISLLIRDLTEVKVFDGDRPPVDPGDVVEPGSGIEADNGIVPPEPEIDWDRLVRACRQRVGVLISKLRAKLAKSVESTEQATWLFGRLLLTFNLVRHLRDRRPPGKWDRRRGRPESLVSAAQIRSLYKAAMDSLYRQEGGIAAKLECSPDHRQAEERGSLDGLMLWAAMEIGADAETQAPAFYEIQEDRARRLSDKADAIVTAMSAAPHPGMESSLLGRTPFQRWKDGADGAGPEWWRRHIRLGTALLQASAKSDGWLPTLKRRAREGDVVVWMKEPNFPRVVVSAAGERAFLIAPGDEEGNNPHRLAQMAVAPVDAVMLGAVC